MELIYNLHDLFTCEEKTYSTDIAMPSPLDESSSEDSEIQAFLQDFKVQKFVVKKGSDWVILKHPNYKHKIKVVMIPVGCSDSFAVEISRVV